MTENVGYCTVLGADSNVTKGSYDVVIGVKNNVSGNENIIIGNNNNITGDNNVIIANNQTIIGDNHRFIESDITSHKDIITIIHSTMKELISLQHSSGVKKSYTIYCGYCCYCKTGEVQYCQNPRKI
jgi:hypothetical protein